MGQYHITGNLCKRKHLQLENRKLVSEKTSWMTRVLICFHAKTKISARRMASKRENCEYFLSHEFPVIQYVICEY